jgi:hypothetical protein
MPESSEGKNLDGRLESISRDLEGASAMSGEQVLMSSKREQDMKMEGKDVSEMLSIVYGINEPIGEVTTERLYDVRSSFDKYFGVETNQAEAGKHTPEWVKKVGTAIEDELQKRGKVQRSL